MWADLEGFSSLSFSLSLTVTRFGVKDHPQSADGVDSVHISLCLHGVSAFPGLTLSSSHAHTHTPPLTDTTVSACVLFKSAVRATETPPLEQPDGLVLRLLLGLEPNPVVL